MNETTNSDLAPFFVRYYDPEMSKRGKGVQRRDFRERSEAEAFAAAHRLYAKPCRVEKEMQPWPTSARA